MSGRDGDEESSEDLWDEVEEFAEDDPSEIEEFADQDSNDEEFVEAEAIEADPVESEAVTDPEPSDDPPTDAFGEPEQATVDEQLPNTGDAPDADEVFDEMDVSAVDGEALWDELAGAEAEAKSFEGEAADDEADDPIDAEPVEPSVGTSADGATRDRSASSEGDTETLVDKRAYCQQCPYFSEPPTVSCGHAGTEIIEVLKDGRFRVRNCPVVTDTGPDRTILNDGH
ncbi:MAG: hypothetical protein U9O06_11940 [Euryarchaeota archaeon]|nr:hypothetical protein [Euryarchaeota archaeon]